MDDLVGRAVFAVGDRSYAWEDVVLGAVLRGDWEPFERSLRRGLACVRRAEAMGDGPSEEALDEAAGEFRYARDLVSAEDMEGWIERRGLDVEAWMGYVLRDLLRRDLAEELEAIEAAYPVDDEDVQAALAAEGLCSGEFSRLAERLAARAAAAERLRDAAPAGSAVEASETDARDPETFPLDSLPGAIRELSPETLRERLREMARLEAAFGDFQRAVVTPEAIQAQLAAHRLEWIQLDCRLVNFPAEDVAREAALCVREDGRDLAEVADETRRAFVEGRFFLEDLGASIRDALLAATPGELLGPLAVNGQFALVAVAEKVMPSQSDPQARRRAEERLVGAAVAHETDRSVRWIDPL